MFISIYIEFHGTKSRFVSYQAVCENSRYGDLIPPLAPWSYMLSQGEKSEKSSDTHISPSDAPWWATGGRLAPPDRKFAQTCNSRTFYRTYEANRDQVSCRVTHLCTDNQKSHAASKNSCWNFSKTFFVEERPVKLLFYKRNKNVKKIWRYHSSFSFSAWKPVSKDFFDLIKYFYYTLRSLNWILRFVLIIFLENMVRTYKERFDVLRHQTTIRFILIFV